MRKAVLIIASIGLIIGGNYSFGQDNVPPPPLPPSELKHNSDKTPAERAADRTKIMKKNLDLSDIQEEGINKINTDHITEMDAIREKIKALKEEAKAKREEHNERINEVLTDEQEKLHREKMAERKSKCNDRKKQNDHGN